MARVRAGDDAAFEELYDRYHRRLLAFCQHMLARHEEAEDVVQHTFLAAYRCLRGGADVADVKPWLYTIARNRCLSVMRARRDEIALDDTATATEGLAAEVDRRADLRMLVSDVQRLPPDQRAALVLFEVGDHSHQEIATVLGVRREKVKALVFQAREALMGWRTARETPCANVREQLASLTGSALGRRTLRRHVEQCPGCADFEVAVRCQRAALAIALPVVPAAGLRAAVLGSAVGGSGLGAAVGGGAASTAAGGLAGLGANALAAKILLVTAVAGGVGATQVAVGERTPARVAAGPPQQPAATAAVHVAQRSTIVRRPARATAPLHANVVTTKAKAEAKAASGGPHVAATNAPGRKAADGTIAHGHATAPGRLKAPGTPAQGRVLGNGRTTARSTKPPRAKTAGGSAKPKPEKAKTVDGPTTTRALKAPNAPNAPEAVTVAQTPPGQSAARAPGQSAAGPPGQAKKQ